MTIQQMVMQLAGGMGISIQIFVVTLVVSLPLGLVIAFGRMSKNKVLQSIVKVYISVMRGTPLMLQLMVVYFGPYDLFGIRVGTSYRLWATFIGFSINYAAYFAEIYRSGIQSMPAGQYEAAYILGYSRFQTFFKIILPQVIKRILPSVTNEVITLVKDTSLAFTLSVAEMFSIAKALAASQTNMIPFVAAGLFYYIFNLVVAVAMEWFEMKLDYYRYCRRIGDYEAFGVKSCGKVLRGFAGAEGHFHTCGGGGDPLYYRPVRIGKVHPAALRHDAGDA